MHRARDRGPRNTEQTQERDRAITPRHEVRNLRMILYTRGIAVARSVVRHVCTKCGPGSRRRTDFFFQHAATAIIAAWEIYHDASGSNESESSNKRVIDASRGELTVTIRMLRW